MKVGIGLILSNMMMVRFDDDDHQVMMMRWWALEHDVVDKMPVSRSIVKDIDSLSITDNDK